MGVTIESNTVTLKALAEKAGVPEQADMLEQFGVELAMAPNGLSLLMAKKVIATVKINTEPLWHYIKGEMGTYSEKLVTEKVQTLIMEAANSLLPDPDTAPAKAPAPSAKKTKKLTPASLTDLVSDAPQHGAEAAFMHNPLGFPKLPKVPLASATALLQSVNGTSESSTYHVVALGDGIAAAARIKCGSGPWKISFRVEGKNVDKYGSLLESAGLASSGTHWSVHLNGDGGEINAIRTIGALVMGSSLPFTQIAMNPMAINGKGS